MAPDERDLQLSIPKLQITRHDEPELYYGAQNLPVISFEDWEWVKTDPDFPRMIFLDGEKISALKFGHNSPDEDLLFHFRVTFHGLDRFLARRAARQ